MIASSCQKPITYVGCIFILINDRIIGNLGAAMQLVELGNETQLSGLRKQAKLS